VRQVGYLQELYRVERSTEHKKRVTELRRQVTKGICYLTFRHRASSI